MKTILVTGYEDSYAELGEITTPVMRAYADRHGFEFSCSREKPFGITTLPQYWLPITNALRALSSGYDRVIQLDADQLITNPNFVPEFEFGFHASRDWGSDAIMDFDFSCCGWVACQEAKEMLEWVMENEASFGFEFPAQNQLRRYASHFKPSWLHVHPIRLFNAVPIELKKFSSEIEIVDPWQEGDWMCHMTMMPLKERVSLAKKLIERKTN